MFGRNSEAGNGKGFEVKVWSKCWYLVDILKLMLG